MPQLRDGKALNHYDSASRGLRATTDGNPYMVTTANETIQLRVQSFDRFFLNWLIEVKTSSKSRS